MDTREALKKELSDLLSKEKNLFELAKDPVSCRPEKQLQPQKKHRAKAGTGI